MAVSELAMYLFNRKLYQHRPYRGNNSQQNCQYYRPDKIFSYTELHIETPSEKGKIKKTLFGFWQSE